MGTHFRGKPGEVRALDTFIKLVRAAETVSSRLARRLESLELTESQFGVLEALHHLGPMCQRALAEKLLRSGGNLTVVIDNLERRGLVRRERDSRDRRYVTVHLTPAGGDLIASVFPGHARAIVDELAGLNATEQEELGRLCRKLGRRSV
jgi:MarR family 2-MHQ and catechol resistance regulon transcriptional repressor